MATIAPEKLVQIRRFVQEFVNPNEEEWEAFTSKLELKHYPKKSFFLKAGEICRGVGFINKGLFRAYKTINGKEITHFFPIEGFFATDYSSFLNRTPSPDSIEALEDSEVLLLSYDNIQDMYQKYHVWERFGRLISEFLYMKLESTINSFQLLSPEERYLKLIEEHPSIYERVSQVHLSSLLGIAPESLSRIRKRMMDKETIKV